MATKEKVQEMLAVINFEKQQEMLAEQFYDSIRTHFTEKEGEIGAETVNFHKKAQTMIFERVNKFIAKIYEDILTDKEVDELIRIYSSPAFKRLQAITPEVTQRLINHVMESMEEIQEKLERMYDEAAEEIIAGKNKTNF